MLTRATSRTISSAYLRNTRASFSKGVKVLNEREKAQEDYYFSKQDEKLIKHMIQESPDMVGMVGSEGVGEPHSVEDKIRLVFMQNGVPPNAHPKLLADLVKLLEGQSRA